MKSTKPENGVAVIMTGAAARIPQQAALLEELDNRGLLKDLVFISGVSSGALNSVVLNGILAGRMNWTDYRDILYNLKNEDIFLKKGIRFPKNTSPSRELFKRIIEDKLGFHTIGDLPICSGISITRSRNLGLKKKVYRMCSQKINTETDTTLNLVDILMASSAFPFVFPGIKIKNVKTIPDIRYMDGGIGEDHVPFKSLIQFEKFRGAEVEKIYVISRKFDNIPSFSQELIGLGLNDKGLFDKIGFSFESILNKGIIRRLRAFSTDYPEHLKRTFIWTPKIQDNFLLLNFQNLKEQYLLTSLWAKTHDPEPLDDFLTNYPIKNK